MVPIAAVVAGAEPEIAAKMQAETTVTCPMPPGRWRTSTSATRISFCDRPPADMISPASMKNGIANRLNDWVAPIRVCASSTDSMSATSSTAAVIKSSAMANGKPAISSTANPADSNQAVADISAALLFVRRYAAFEHRLQREQCDQHAAHQRRGMQQLIRIPDRRRRGAAGFGEIAPA